MKMINCLITFLTFSLHQIGSTSWYFWPKILASDNEKTWMTNVIGGETSPNLQSSVFESTYVTGSDQNKQDFMECIRTTHATYMIHGDAFAYNGYSGTELETARYAHSRMGYNYVVTKIGVMTTSESTISMDVTLMQIGVAPFYYPLSLVLHCPGSRKVVNGLEKTLKEINGISIFRFNNIPTNTSCLQNMKLQLASSMLYDARPLKFAQGDGSVSFSVPLPPSITTPIRMPVRAPVPVPVRTTIPVPIRGLVPLPSPIPDVATNPAPVRAMVPVTARIPVGGAVPSPVRVLPTSPALSPRIPSPLVDGSYPSPISAPSLGVTIMTLIDAQTNDEIGIMTNDMTINVENDRSFSIMATPPQSFEDGSVQFVVDDQVTHTENNAPFTISGNFDGTIQPRKPTLGKHKIQATPFTAKNANGEPGIPAILIVTVVSENPVPKMSIFDRLFQFITSRILDYM
jgi:hypothetical protein